jgi:hypothetical protein
VLGAGFKPVGELHSQPFDSAFVAEASVRGRAGTRAVDAKCACVMTASASVERGRPLPVERVVINLWCGVCG